LIGAGWAFLRAGPAATCYHRRHFKKQGHAMTRLLLPALVAAIVAASPARAAPDRDAAIGRVLPDLVEVRHRIHANPELSNREHQTAALLVDRLKRLDLDMVTGVAHTGVLAVVRAERSGPVVAFRADMDALPVTEQTDLPFRSTVRTEYDGEDVGVAHACGHDVHTTIALGLAAVLAGMREEFAGTVMIIFQPAEEGAPPGEEGGAEMMLAEGVFADPRPEAIFALHAWPTLPIGQVGFGSGPVFASSDRFTVTLRGKQSHGAYPHQGVDPVVLASQVVLGFQTIRSRTLDPVAPGVVTTSIIRGGERFNIIPDDVYLEGTVRAFDPAVQDVIEARMRAILDGMTSAAGATYEFTYDRQNPYVNNDPPLAAWSRASLVRTLGKQQVVDIDRTMGAEDFAWFAREVPGFYLRLGTVEEGTTSGGLHTPDFRAGDGAIEVGLRAVLGLVLDYLEQGGPQR
jgi:amidohydrolase